VIILEIFFVSLSSDSNTKLVPQIHIVINFNQASKIKYFPFELSDQSWSRVTESNCVYR
jgi:hypothetical protein